MEEWRAAALERKKIGEAHRRAAGGCDTASDR